MDLIPIVRKCSTVLYFFIFSGLGRAMAKMSSVIQCEYIPSIAKSSFFQAVSDSYLHRRPPQNTEHLQYFGKNRDNFDLTRKYEKHVVIILLLFPIDKIHNFFNKY